MSAVQEQAARLRAAFEAGMQRTSYGPGDVPTYDQVPVVPNLRPDYGFTVGEFRGRACVVVEFALDGGPPGLRWLHRFRPPPQGAGWQPDVLSWFQEGVDCWMGRSLARVPAGTSPVWTDFSWGHPTQRWDDALQMFADGDLALAAETLSDDPPDDEARQLAARITGLLALGDAPDAEPLREGIYKTFHGHSFGPGRTASSARREADRAATEAFMRENRNPDGSWGPAWPAAVRA